MHVYITGLRATRDHNRQKVSINSYKLFYFRHHALKVGLGAFSKRTGIPENRLINYEKINKKIGSTSEVTFPICENEDLKVIETTLGVPNGTLMTGRDDDFLAKYLLYYSVYHNKKANPNKEHIYRMIYNCKIIVFDFDGTF